MIRFLRRRWRALLILFVLFILAVAVFVRVRMQGPYRDYAVQQAWLSQAEPGAPLQVGAAVRDITPDLEAYDSWVDVDKNSKFEPKKGDTYTDRNGNGDFDFLSTSTQLS